MFFYPELNGMKLSEIMDENRIKHVDDLGYCSELTIIQDSEYGGADWFNVFESLIEF